MPISRVSRCSFFDFLKVLMPGTGLVLGSGKVSALGYHSRVRGWLSDGRVRGKTFALLCLLAATVACAGSAREKVVWPTSNSAFQEGKPPRFFAQPTERGTIESGLFGCVRNGATRFHEGLDLRAISRASNGEAADLVFAVMDGRVAYLNDRVENSDYGRYVVIEHVGMKPVILSLYAHLGEIRDGLVIDSWVGAGEVLGRMGRSAGGYRIPKERAHLHFELGLRLSDRFDSWYERRKFKKPNYHGKWNGWNLVGFDPLDFYRQFRQGRVGDAGDYIQSLSSAFTVRIETAEIPDYVLRYPELLASPIPVGGVVAWEIDFSWYGLPQRWNPVGGKSKDGKRREGALRLLRVRKTSETEGNCRDTVELTRSGYRIGGGTRQTLEILFLETKVLGGSL